MNKDMYDKETVRTTAEKAIIDNKLMFIEEVVAFLPCAKSTFYSLFPIESNEYKELFALIEKNRTLTKATLRGKWYKSNAPALQISLYKLIASPEERRALNSQTHEFEIPEDTEIKISIKR